MDARGERRLANRSEGSSTGCTADLVLTGSILLGHAANEGRQALSDRRISLLRQGVHGPRSIDVILVAIPMKNSQVAILCGAILAGALIIAGANAWLVRSLKNTPGAASSAHVPAAGKRDQTRAWVPAPAQA